MRLRALLVVAGSVWWLGGPTALAQPTGVTGYEVLSVGAPNGYRASSARALDEFGRVVVSVRDPNNAAHAAVWINGNLILLPPPKGGERASAKGISPTTGIISGVSSPNGPTQTVAWVIGPHAIHVLDNLPGGQLTSCGSTATNDLGWIVGSCSSPNRSTLWPALDPPIDLGNLGTGGGLEFASDINELGEIVGSSRNTCGEERPYLWRNGEMIDIGGEPCYATGDALGINNFTEVVGSSATRRLGFHWQDGVRTDLPRVYPCGNTINRAYAINDSGLIVGEDAGSTCDRLEAALWERSQGFRGVIINDYIPRHPDVSLLSAKDINSAGQIAAFGEYDDGRERGFLVTPYLFEMSDPVPGIAGQPNTITITGLQPNQRVLLAYGTREGAQKIRPSCPGGTLLIRDPQASPIARADANGIATITVNVPPAARGRTIRMQAIAPFECEISHTVTWTFE